MQVTIQIEQNLVKHFSFKQKFPFVFLFINNNNNINIYQKQFLHDQEVKEGLREAQSRGKVRRKEEQDNLLFPPVMKRLSGKGDIHTRVYMCIYIYIHTWTQMEKESFL